MIGREVVREGMSVFEEAGSKLGSVVLLRDTDFLVQNRNPLASRRYYLFAYDDVADVQGDDLFVTTASAELQPEWEGYAGDFPDAKKGSWPGPHPAGGASVEEGTSVRLERRAGSQEERTAVSEPDKDPSTRR